MPPTPAQAARSEPVVEAKPGRDTPAMRQYFGFKKQHPGCVLFFRMGDFYEMFDEDAVTAHKAIGLTLTERSPGMPMAGVPHHTAETYIGKLLAQGFRVAVADQIQDPRDAKGVVDRAVTRVLTPGTLVDESLLIDDAPNHLAAVTIDNGRAAAAVVELSTGDFELLDCPLDQLADELSRRTVSEVLHPDTIDASALASLPGARTARPAWQFRPTEAREALLAQYRVATLEGFGVGEDDPAVPAAGGVLRYLRETQAPGDPSGAGSLGHLRPPRRTARAGRMAIDATTLRALEVTRTIREGDGDSSLLGVFLAGAGKRTPMGRRLLREWLTSPLADIDAINARQACVATLAQDRRLASELGERTGGVQDVARIAGRLGLGRATPRDLSALGASLRALPHIAACIEGAPALAALRTRLQGLAQALGALGDAIYARCVDAPPAHMREGGLFRDGVDAELDEARGLQRDASTWLAAHQAELVEKHQLPNLKVGYNRVFGYYIELPAAQARRAPDTFTRKQTLKNAERYITPQLKEFEDKVLTAERRAIEREQALFGELCAQAGAALAPIAAYADAVAELDALACFAEVAARRGWVRPEITDDQSLDIEQGRHPVLERLLADAFVPNDLRLAAGDVPACLALITGPNMAGKSTYIRQAALLTLLAHTGSFVPAQSARIGLCDRVFTRVGADDALHAGQSTFMVEMTETASILHNATHKSLVILDEIGRGTSTLDGLALAWAIGERLAGTKRHPGPRTLFATHYHELTTMQEQLQERVTNLHVSVREWGDEIVFLHRILPGRADRSYGIHVAKLAGLPKETIARAQDLLESLAVSHEGAPPPAHRRTQEPRDQPSLFDTREPHPVVTRLREIDINTLTPLEAFDVLRELKDHTQP